MYLKRILTALLPAILLIVIIIFSLFIYPFLGTKKVTPGTVLSGGKVISVIDGFSQVFIIDCGNSELALIDAGNSTDGKPLLDALAARKMKPANVKAIFLTHGHNDHIASVKIFPNAKIYALKSEVAIVEGLETNRSPITRFISPKPTGIKVSNILNDGDVVKTGDMKVEVFAIPGHTQGSAAFLAAGVLFVGDAALSSPDGKLKQSVWVFSTDVNRQNLSLKLLASKLINRRGDVRHIAFSHSGYIDGLQPLIDYAEKIK